MDFIWKNLTLIILFFAKRPGNIYNTMPYIGLCASFFFIQTLLNYYIIIMVSMPLWGFRTLTDSVSILFCWYICRSVSKGNVTSWNFFKWRPSERNKRETAKQRWRSLSANPCRFKMQCTCADAVCQMLSGWYASLLFSSFPKIWHYMNINLKYLHKYSQFEIFFLNIITLYLPITVSI